MITLDEKSLQTKEYDYYKPITLDPLKKNEFSCYTHNAYAEEKDEINIYRNLLKEELIKLGATDQEIKLIKDATIRNAIKRNRKPEDVAWAILQ